MADRDEEVVQNLARSAFWDAIIGCDARIEGDPTKGIAIIATALRAAREEGRPKWQTIDTAPRDGTYVLLGGFVVPSATAQANGSKTTWDYGIGVYLWDDKWTGFVGSRPTHWMPLWEPPK